MKPIIKYSFFFALLLLCGYAFADDGNGTGLPSALTPSSNDQSLYYLGVIFGNVGNVLSGSGGQLLGVMFGEFNRAVLILGTIIFTYVYGKGILDTAAHGEFLGKNTNSLWVPIRSIGGLALMIPKASTGYCVIQVFLMWVVLQGIGAADMIWTTLAASINSSSSNSQQDASAAISASIATQMVPQVQNIFSSLVCGYAVQRSQNSGAVIPYYRTEGNNRYYDINYYAAPGNKTLSCGTVSWSNSCAATDVNCQTLISDQQDAISNIINNLTPIASFYVADSYRYCNQLDANGNCVTPAYPQSFNDTGNNQTVANDVYKMAGQINFPQDQMGDYVDRMASDKAGQQPVNPSGQPTGNDMVDNGWIYAGSYIYKLASSINQSGTIPNFTVSVASMSDISSYFPKNYPNPMQMANSYMQNLPSDQQSGGGQATNPNNDRSKLEGVFLSMTALTNAGLGAATAIAAEPVPALAILTGALIGVVTSFDVILNMIIEQNSNPLSAILYLQTFGYIVLAIVGITFGLMLVGIFVTGLGENIMNCMQPVGFAAAETLSYVSYLVMAVFAGLIAIGVFLAVYLPLLPFIYFTFGVLGWLMAVFETMLAAPIVALGVIHPEGHDFWGKAEPAVMLTVNVFLRPSLMLFGLMAAVLIGYVFVDIITTGFALSIFNMQDKGYAMINPIEAVAVMALYTFLIVVGYTQCFKLITEVGNKVLTWIGFQGQLGGSADEAVGQMKQHGAEVGGSIQSGFKDTESKIRDMAGAKRKDEKDATNTGMGGGGSVHTAQNSSPKPTTQQTLSGNE